MGDQEHHFPTEDRLTAQSALRKIEELIEGTKNRRFSTCVWPPVVHDYPDLKLTYEEGEQIENMKPQLLGNQGSPDQTWTLSTIRIDAAGRQMNDPLGIEPDSGS